MNIRINKIICTFLLICIFFGNLIKIDNLKIAGMIVTLYRTGVPTCALYFVCKRFFEKDWKALIEKKSIVIFFGIMLFWICKGCFLTFTSEYVVLKEALKEILNLVLGVLTVYCLIECIVGEEMFSFFIKALKLIIGILCVLAICEGVSGIHFSSSKYFVQLPVSDVLAYFLDSIETGQIYPMTTLFYGMNDFSALLSILFPLFLYDINEKKNWKNFLMLILAIIIITTNDSNISLITITFISFVWIIFKKIEVRSLLVILYIVFIDQIGKKWFQIFIKWIKMNIYSILEKILDVSKVKGKYVVPSIINSDVNFIDVIGAQTNNFAQQSGSLYLRLMMTYDACDMIFATGFMGVGPAAFSNYLKVNGSRTYLVDPHNFWLEILAQYGIIVFLMYVAFLLYLFIGCFRRYLVNKEKVLLMYICIVISYVLSSIAPSSFLNYPYHWIVPAMGIVLLIIYDKSKA